MRTCTGGSEAGNIAEAFTGTVSRDFLRLFVKHCLAVGGSREVYATAQPSLVLKMELEAGSFQNAIEWRMWQEVKGGPLAEHFAPCTAISPCGIFLLQRRTTPLAPDNVVPEFMSSLVLDAKRENFGLYRGRVVCHDYGWVPMRSTLPE